MEQKMLTVPGLAVRNLRHRRVRTMFLAALVLILSAALFTSRVLTESMKTCIDKTVDRIGADVIVAPGEYESDLSDSLFSGGLCSFYFEKSLMDQVKKTDGIPKRHFISVDFPAPFSPISAWTVPALTVRDT